MGPRYKASGDFLTARRKELGLTREALAEQLGIGLKNVESWEQGYARPKHYRDRLAKALGLTYEQLMVGTTQRRERINEKDYGLVEGAMTLGDFIAERRTGLGMSWEELAKAVGVSSNAVRDWEGNKYRPTAHVQKLADVLTVETGELIALMNQVPSPLPKSMPVPAPVPTSKSAPALIKVNGASTNGNGVHPKPAVEPDEDITPPCYIKSSAGLGWVDSGQAKYSRKFGGDSGNAVNGAAVWG
jgi:transcriptional regulator with XRE-family HTH domain